MSSGEPGGSVTGVVSKHSTHSLKPRTWHAHPQIIATSSIVFRGSASSATCGQFASSENRQRCVQASRRYSAPVWGVALRALAAKSCACYVSVRTARAPVVQKESSKQSDNSACWEMAMTGWGKWCRSACLVALLNCVGGLTCRAEGDAGVDDGWRRTAQGWERIDSWTRAQTTSLHDYRFDAVDRSVSYEERRDFHPAVLGGVQMLIVGAALFILSPHRRSNGAISSVSIVPRHRQAA